MPIAAYLRMRAFYGRILLAAGTLAGAVTFLMMVLVVANVVMRSFFDVPVDGTLELTQSSLVVLIFLSLALTQYEGGHIHVVLITGRLPAGLQRLMNFIAMALGFAFFAWATYAAFGLAMRSYAIGEQQWGSIRYPLWPVKFISFAGLLALAVQFFIDALGVLIGAPIETRASLAEDAP